MIKILLAGEGPNELGKWARDPSYRGNYENGVVEELLKKVCDRGWEVVDGVSWKKIRKYKRGGRKDAEMKNVMGLAEVAKEKGCDVLVFVRDRDGTRSKKNIEREESIRRGIEAANKSPGCPGIVGGMAVKMLESWLLALRGRTDSEKITDPKSELEKMEVEMNTAGYVDLVKRADLDLLPRDAGSLKEWLKTAEAVLSVLTADLKS